MSTLCYECVSWMHRPKDLKIALFREYLKPCKQTKLDEKGGGGGWWESVREMTKKNPFFRARGFPLHKGGFIFVSSVERNTNISSLYSVRLLQHPPRLSTHTNGLAQVCTTCFEYAADSNAEWYLLPRNENYSCT